MKFTAKQTTCINNLKNHLTYWKQTRFSVKAAKLNGVSLSLIEKMEAAGMVQKFNVLAWDSKKGNCMVTEWAFIEG